MKKFNIRKVLDGFTAAAAPPAAAAPAGTPREADAVPESLTSELFQLCKVGRTAGGGARAPAVTV